MNLFELFVKIGVKDEASKNVSSIASKLGNGLKTAAKVGTAAVGVASAAIVGLTKQSIESYAEYEQLVGGAQLMFGKAYDTVAKNAQEAYKTVQMSQNEYLQQVNGFATGLKTALGGNEQAAAELADRIVNAEADIIAATGNAAENVQNAFNGIMRSNFTMLDNLQIGITPTKEGFQDLIDKVNEWNTTNGKATDYQMGNLADMQSALVDYIDMVGYSGYAQAEASKTIQGSLASARGAYQNLLTGMADDNADFGLLVNNFVDSVGTVAENIIPRVQIALEGAGTLVEKLVPVIIEKVPEIVTETLPKILQSGVNIIKTILEGISKDPDKVVDTILLVMDILIDTIIDLLPELLVVGVMLIGMLAVGLIKAIPELVAKIPQLIKAIVNGFKDKSGDFVKIGKDAINAILDGLKRAWTAVKNWFNNAWDSLFGNRSVDVSANVSGSGVDGSHAGGLDYVPFDGYVAELHKGEQVLTAEEARDYKRGGKVVSVVQNIYSQAKTAADLMQEARYQQERAVLFGV